MRGGGRWGKIRRVVQPIKLPVKIGRRMDKAGEARMARGRVGVFTELIVMIAQM